MIRLYQVLFLLFIISVRCAAQVDTEFWFAPPEITSGHGDVPLVLRVSTQSEAATVEVSLPANDNLQLANVTIPANTTHVLDLSNFKGLLETYTHNTVLETGLRVVSTAPITAYYEEASFYNAEIFVLKGKNALGKRFMIAAQGRYQNSADYSPLAYFSFDIVATENNTLIKVRPTKPLLGHENESIITVRLNKGETYSFRKVSSSAYHNPIGTIVESSKPIAITIKDDSVINEGCRDLLGDQLIPVEVAGKEYIVVKGFLSNGEFFFITATENNTNVYLEGSNVPTATLNAGEFREFLIRAPAVHILSDKRIYVVHVTGFGCEMGMTVLPPVNCTGSRQVGFTRSSSEFFGMDILVRKEGVPHFTLNGSTTLIPPEVFHAVPGTDDKWYSAQLSFETRDVPVNQSSLIRNEHHSFQAGIVNGNAATSARYGYFSSFSTLFIGDNLAFCDGATALIDAGPGKESYLWSTGATTQSIQVDQSGEYWVKVTREDCVLYDTIRVNERTGTVDLGPDVGICVNETTHIDGGENFSWQWSDGSTKQVLETKEIGKYWVTISDDVGCQASDTVVVDRLVYTFDNDVAIKLRYVSVDTSVEQYINLGWTIPEKERQSVNSVFVYKRPMGGPNWDLIARLPADVETFQDVSGNATDETIYEYFVSLADPCGLEHRYSNYHNTIRLFGIGDESTNKISLDWNHYHNWNQGVGRYEIWRTLEEDSSYSFFREVSADVMSFTAEIATDAFHHRYIVRAIESSGESESWSNNIDVNFEHPVFVPNVFTPNDDMYNQYFEIRNIGIYKNSRLIILDRWGLPIFESDGYQNDWDGGGVSSGIYYYILSLNRNGAQPIKGPLSIIK
ncbi:MAG TPA: gliding motility-associated C-terminal domain-containing protein [Chryseolinea sp.]